jgi:hypothetical protein
MARNWIALYRKSEHVPRRDPDLAAWLGEIKCRACIRIGELSREMEKAEANGRGLQSPALSTSGPAPAGRAIRPARSRL